VPAKGAFPAVIRGVFSAHSRRQNCSASARFTAGMSRKAGSKGAPKPVVSATRPAVFGVVRMSRVGQGVHNLLVAGESSGVFERALPATVVQMGVRTIFVRGPAGNQIEPGKPAVSKVVFVERSA
jgi:hypothetical protein